ncbi:MAG: M48 family metalloprotease [Verrucomicrobiota bacterium]
MTREEFDVLIQRLEKISRKNPRLYLLRVIGLVVLAYGYLLTVLFGSLALCLVMLPLLAYVPVLAIFGFITFASIFLALARGLWVKIEPPKGQPIKRAEAPRLFTLLDELCAALHCRPFHEVLIVGAMNAGVVQIPRFGIFGWHRNYLVLGLPLMQSLAPEEFKAVLAHEFAHSSRGHGRLGNWLYRVRRSWAQIFAQMGTRRTRFGRALFKGIHWFWPIFNGHVFVLARANEYEADACSVRLAGANAAANALVRTRVDGSFFSEKFWPDIFKLTKEVSQPPANVMLSFPQALKGGPSADDTTRWLRQAFLIETNNADTHPCLKDRLRAIGRLPSEVEQGKFLDAPPVPSLSAFEFFLGNHAEVVAQRVSEDWRRDIAKQWAARHEKSQKLAGEIAGFETPTDAPPTAAQIWKKAQKIVELSGDSAGIAMLEQVIALEPGHAGANLILGRHFLQSDDPQGVKFIETAMASDPSLAQTGCNLLHVHFNRTGQRDKLRPLENRFDDLQKLNALARQERARISAADTFLAHELDAEQIAALRQIFSTEPDIGSAAVARKQVVHLPMNPCFVISLNIKVSWWKLLSSAANRNLVPRVLKQVRLPGYFLVFLNEKNLKGLGTKVLNVPDAIIYERAEGN